MGNTRKSIYSAPKFCIITYSSEDIITTSGVTYTQWNWSAGESEDDGYLFG